MSLNKAKLNQIKKRPLDQHIIQEVADFKQLKKNTRVPNKYKNFIRRSKNTTFIYPNNLSFRVIDSNSLHYNFISKIKQIYSTSANQTGKHFKKELATNMADIIVYTNNEFMEFGGSDIYKVSNHTMKKVR